MTWIAKTGAGYLGMLAGLLLLSACAASPPVQYFTLPLPAASAAPAAHPAGPVIALGPVSLPETVDRSQIVLNLTQSRLEVMSELRWAQPLRAEISRGLAANLARLPGAPRVQLHGQATFGEPDLRVRIDILRFESWPDAEALVEAQWSVRSRHDDRVRRGHALVRQPVSGKGYEALAVAHGHALEALARSIAGTLPAEP